MMGGEGREVKGRVDRRVMGEVHVHHRMGGWSKRGEGEGGCGGIWVE